RALFVALPRARALFVPPLTSQFLNLTKNSSLAVVIGYPELVSVFMGTVLNQTGQAVEVIAVTMGGNFSISVLTSHQPSHLRRDELVQPAHRPGREIGEGDRHGRYRHSPSPGRPSPRQPS